MKQISFTSLLIFGLSMFCMAQKDNSKNQKNRDTIHPTLTLSKEPRFLMNIHGGYALGLGSTFKFYPDDVSSVSVFVPGNGTPGKSTNYRNPTKGLGDGFRIGGGFSFILNDFINIGMDLDYFKSTIKKTRDSSYLETQISSLMPGPDEYGYQERKTISYNATLITLTPHITFKAISRPKWFIYNKIGAVVSFRPNSVQKEVTDITVRQGWQGFYKDSLSQAVTNYEWGIKKPALGFMGAFGMQVKIAKKLRAFGELQFSHIVFIARRRSLTDFAVDGRDMKSTLPVSLREIEFVKSFSTGSNSNPDQPVQALIQRIPITYIGVQLGIAFQLR
ncbi:MAG: hypothetical protein H7Z13_00095 [Ferruginibacter sp.]|nr:hypothetical protein [Ferruginibacter sp.]